MVLTVCDSVRNPQNIILGVNMSSHSYVDQASKPVITFYTVISVLRGGKKQKRISPNHFGQKGNCPKFVRNESIIDQNVQNDSVLAEVCSLLSTLVGYDGTTQPLDICLSYMLL